MPPMIRDKTSFDAIVDPASSQTTISLKRIWRKAMPRANPASKRSSDGSRSNFTRSHQDRFATFEGSSEPMRDPLYTPRAAAETAACSSLLISRPYAFYFNPTTSNVMASSQSLEPSFGWEPSDHFLLYVGLHSTRPSQHSERDQALSNAADVEQKEKWDPESSLHQDEQEQNLIRAWINLGERGRSLYRERCDDIPLPQYIPSNLSVFEKRRKVTDSGEWDTAAGAIWIRTWYGNEASLGKIPDEEIVTRARADEAYVRLWRKALHPYQHHYEFDAAMFGHFIFDDNDAVYGVAAGDADDEVELMDGIPSFILSALIRCPDAIEGSSEREIMEEDDHTELQQSLLVVVADREACEEGWVLLIALNHRGQALHMRVRCKAYQVWEQVNHFRDGGDPLDITESKENVVDYLDGNRSGNGWDKDEPQA